MPSPAQRRAVDHFAKSLSALGDDSLIDAYHQACEDHRDARAEGSDNLGKAGAESLVTETAMRERVSDYQSRYKQRVPVNQLVSPSPAPITPAAFQSSARLAPGISGPEGSPLL
jgi:hypothetical protein